MSLIGRVLFVFLSRFLVLFVRRLKDLSTEKIFKRKFSRENKGMEEVRSLLLSYSLLQQPRSLF